MSYTRRSTVDLFTSDEHAVLAEWFGAEPPSFSKDIDADEASNRLGFVERPGHYQLIDPAVAFIVLENVEKRLPQWAVVREDTL